MPNSLRINFYFDEEIPKPSVTVKINNLPANYKYLSCILRNYQMDEKIIPPKIIHLSRPSKPWFHAKVSNALCQLDEDEYQSLDETWKDEYSHDDTDKISFTIDYLFNDLLANDADNILIYPEMVDSFYKLAYETSAI